MNENEILEPKYITNCNQTEQIVTVKSSCSSGKLYNELSSQSVFARGVSRRVQREASVEGKEVQEYIQNDKTRDWFEGELRKLQKEYYLSPSYRDSESPVWN